MGAVVSLRRATGETGATSRFTLYGDTLGPTGSPGATYLGMERANAEFPPFPDYNVPTGAVHTAFFFSSPGSVYRATKSGTWGDARKATAEIGERYIQAGARATRLLLENIEKTFAAMPPR